MSDDANFTNTLQDAIGGVAIVAFIVVAIAWLGGVL